jgi:DNA-binding GntR family transcriptional regulator
VNEHQEIIDAIRDGNRRRIDGLLRTDMDASAARLSAPSPAAAAGG